MSALVKKEIRLVLPAWIVAMLLALVQGITRPYDFYIASLLFFGLTIMALSTIGRETSLNTFSSLLAQPAERVRIWKTKLTVLSVAFLTVFAVWLAAFSIAFLNSHVDASDRENSYNLFTTVCLIGTATFTGGLWTTLLLRQLAGAFWLTLLVPAVLSGFSGALSAQSGSDNLAIAVMSVVIGIYSVAGFLFSRWLFFRAQDVGWSGGNINLPEWSFVSNRSETDDSTRKRKPLFALLKKEVLLHQATLTGAAGLLVLHLAVIALRGLHKFPRESVGEILTSIFWMLWLIMPVIIGSLAMAEERKLGVMEGLLCLPVSRRVQFAIKTFVALSLGIFLGGVMPVLLETFGLMCGSLNPMFMSDHARFDDAGLLRLSIFLLCLMAFSAWLGLVSYFASSLAKNFLQAVGIGLVTFVVLSLVIPFGSDAVFHGRVPPHSMLLMLIAVPTIILTLLWQAYLNYKNFREGWRVWRRTLLGMGAALLFILSSSPFIYNRGWEYFKPMEPPHGAAKLSLANPPKFEITTYNNLLVRLPDGRVWFDYLSPHGFNENHSKWSQFTRDLVPQLPTSAGPQKFLFGSNWVSVTAQHIDETIEKERGSKEYVHILGYADSVGVHSDGTLWVSDKSDQNIWTADHVTRFGDETNWQRVVPSYRVTMVFLLKKDGTLWRWGTNHIGHLQWPQQWPGLRAFQPQQVGTNSDWRALYPYNLAEKTNASVWQIGQNEPRPETNFDWIPLAKLAFTPSWDSGAYIREDGTLWLYDNLPSHGQYDFRPYQSGHETNWIAVVKTWEWMVALKADGTLWKWDPLPYQGFDFNKPPTRLGIHNDWVAITAAQDGAVTLAADGSLWFWPNRSSYEYQQTLLKLPKQPKFLGNVLSKED